MDTTSKSYEQRLQELTDNIPGALSAILSGIDGIGVASYNFDPAMDAALADAEFATMLSSANRAAVNLAVGEIIELMFTTESVTVMLKLVGRDFYLSVGMQAGAGNLGMARLQMRRAADDFMKILY